MSAPEFDSFERASARAEGYRWVEGQLFEVVGGWVPSVGRPELKLAMRAQSFAHARRARRWADLLPMAPAPGPVDAPRPGAELVATVAQAPSDAGKAAALWTVVLPWLRGRYRAEEDHLSTAAGGPQRRLLRALVGELEAELADTAALVLPAEEDGTRDRRYLERLEGLAREAETA